MPKSFTKAPGEKLDYQEDWSDWLGTETIASSSWDVPSGLTGTDSSNDSDTTTIFLSGGSIGGTYMVRNVITTSSSPAKIAARHIFISISKR